MRNLWIRFGCFLTGYNYKIIRNSSEASAKQVMKYLSALVIISILWAFIGFNFSQRYLQTDDLTSGIVAFILVVVVIQIERQIILTTSKSNLAYTFRIVIGIVMAIIGSVIIDQIIFREDIEKQKIIGIQEEVDQVLEKKTKQLESEISDLDMAIQQKEGDYSELISELDKKPYITTYSSQTQHETDTAGIRRETSLQTNRVQVLNPKADLLPKLDSQMQTLRRQKSEKQQMRVNYREELESEFMETTGFLDELKHLFNVILSSTVAIVIWVIIFVFFLSLELFVIVGKIGDSHNDYDKVIMHQVQTRSRMIDQLGENEIAKSY